VGKGGEFVLAHFSDPHLTELQGIRGRELLNKRALGYRSWRRNRRHEHRPEVLAALLCDLRRLSPDHLVITGDMTHLGTPREFREVADWLATMASPTDLTIVPGNHDTYVHEPWETTLALWAPYMASDRQLVDRPGPDAERFFPSLRVRSDFALIGVNSARPSAPLLAVGSIGQQQMGTLEQMLGETGRRGLCRILLIHHPPVPGSIRWRKRLTDCRDLQDLIAEQGVEMVLHGHAHTSSLNWLSTPLGAAPVIGVRSASSVGRKPGHRAQYHIHRLVAEGDGWRMTLSVREYDPEEDRFVPLKEWALELGTKRSQGVTEVAPKCVSGSA
jgi:3',5'-cyclic AMP phosphodiesterase CpdA